MRKIGIILATIALSAFIAIPSFAAGTKQVAIELDTQTDGADSYMPGENIKYDVILKNLLGESWVRVKFGFSKKLINQDFSDDNLNILPGQEKHGEYYYYTKKASANTDLSVVDGLVLPMVENAQNGTSVTVTVDADAVQYDVFKPDFKKDNPQDGAKVISSAHSSGAKVVKDSNFIHMHSYPGKTGIRSKGQWIWVSKEHHLQKFVDPNGNYAKDGQIYTYNPYSPTENKYDQFHFDEDGFMTFGWYKATTSIWYYTHENSDGNLGMLIKEQHFDQNDNRAYFLDETTGIMLSGWQTINGKSYYFATLSDIPKQTWFWETGFGKQMYKLIGYRSYGSMYVNELSPDGRTLGINGAEVQT